MVAQSRGRPPSPSLERARWPSGPSLATSMVSAHCARRDDRRGGVTGGAPPRAGPGSLSGAAVSPLARRSAPWRGGQPPGAALRSVANSCAPGELSPLAGGSASNLLRSGRSRLLRADRRRISCAQAGVACCGRIGVGSLAFRPESPAERNAPLHPSVAVARGPQEAISPMRVSPGCKKSRRGQVSGRCGGVAADALAVPAVATPVPDDRCMVEPSINRAPQTGTP
jgi:hypothetical protein